MMADAPIHSSVALQVIRKSVEPPSSVLEDVLLEGLLSKTREALDKRALRHGADGKEDRTHACSRAYQYLVHHHAEAITEQDLSVNMSMSVKALRREFASHFRVTPMQMLRIIRVEQAERLLATTEFKIEVIAHMVGLRSKASLYRLFGKLRGGTPANTRVSFRRGN